MFPCDTRITDSVTSTQSRKTNISQENIFLPILGSRKQKSTRESSLTALTLPTFQLRTVRGKIAMGPNTYIPLLSRNPTCNKHFYLYPIQKTASKHFIILNSNILNRIWSHSRTSESVSITLPIQKETRSSGHECPIGFPFKAWTKINYCAPLVTLNKGQNATAVCQSLCKAWNLQTKNYV